MESSRQPVNSLVHMMSSVGHPDVGNGWQGEAGESGPNMAGSCILWKTKRAVATISVTPTQSSSFSVKVP